MPKSLLKLLKDDDLQRSIVNKVVQHEQQWIGSAKRRRRH